MIFNFAFQLTFLYLFLFFVRSIAQIPIQMKPFDRNMVRNFGFNNLQFKKVLFSSQANKRIFGHKFDAYTM